MIDRSIFYHVHPSDVKDIPKRILNGLAWGGKRLNSTQVGWLKDRMRIVEKAEADKLFHMVPFFLTDCFESAETLTCVQDLRGVFGKGLYKSLLKNTLERNKLIVRVFGMQQRSRAYEELADPSSIGLEHRLEDFASLQQLSTTSLRMVASGRFNYSSQKYISWAEKVAKTNPLVEGDLVKTISRNAALFRDTHYLLSCEALEREGIDLRLSSRQTTVGRAIQSELFCKASKWSYRRMKEEHDEATKRYRFARQPNYNFDWISDLGLVGPFSVLGAKGLVAEPLLTSKELVEEGNEMSHCVGSYSEHVKSKSCLIFKITGTKDARSTVSIATPHLKEYCNSYLGGLLRNLVVKEEPHIEQHYAAYNKPVENTKAKKLAEVLPRLVKQLSAEKV